MKSGPMASLLCFKVASRKRVLLFAVSSLACNSLYALYHGVLGVLQPSLWFLAMCAFYSILAVLRFCAVLCGREASKDTATLSESFVLKASGLLLLLLSVVLAWVNAISLSQNIAASYGEITMITIATYTFYKITTVIVKAIRQRKNSSLLLIALRNISYAEAAASVLTLQRSMLVSFGQLETGQACIMNALTGAAICIFILWLGVFVIIRSRKEDKSWQSQNL